MPLRKPRRLRDVHLTRRGLILAWFSFAVTFGVLRAITWSIHAHVGHFANVKAGVGALASLPVGHLAGHRRGVSRPRRTVAEVAHGNGPDVRDRARADRCRARVT